MAEILEVINVYMCFDTGHKYASMGKEQMESFLRQHSHIISHLHIQDSKEGKDLHMPIGSVEIDFEAIAEKLSNFDQTVTMKVFTQEKD